MRHVSIALDQVADEAVLAEPVCDGNGQVLLPAGTELTANMIASLRRRGVVTLVVIQPDVRPDPEPGRDTRPLQEQIEQRLQRLFRHARRIQQVNPLFHMIARYRLEDRA